MSESQPAKSGTPRRRPPKAGDGQAGRAHHSPGHPARRPVVDVQLQGRRFAAVLAARSFRQREQQIKTAGLGCVATRIAAATRYAMRHWLCITNASTRGAHLNRAAGLAGWQRVSRAMIALEAAMAWARQLQRVNPPSIRKMITVTGRDYIRVGHWQPIHPATNSWGPIN